MSFNSSVQLLHRVRSCLGLLSSSPSSLEFLLSSLNLLSFPIILFCVGVLSQRQSLAMESSSNSHSPIFENPEIFNDILEEDNMQNNELAERALVGKIKASKIFNVNVVKEIVTKAWNASRNVHITELGQNMFLFCFPTTDEANEVLRKVLWFVMNQLLCLEQWHPQIS